MQRAVEKLHAVALAGMNCGDGGHLADSGETHVLRSLRRLFRNEPELVFFDAGANKGAYTEALLAASAWHPKARVYGFEPSPTLFVETEARLQKHSEAGRVSFFNVGFSSEERSAVLYGDASSSGEGHNSLYARRLDHFGLALNEKESVKLTTLDRFCQDQGVTRIHFLKLDIEGHELAALQGAKTLLERDAIDAIQFEFGGCNIDSRTYFQDFFYLLNGRYEIYRVLAHGLFKIDRYRESHEIFLTTNFFAVRRSLHANLLRD
jgi:FkbM family methyltransferase